MGRPRLYAPGCAPSDLKDYHKPYVPRPKSARRLAIDIGLEELCVLQVGHPLTQDDIAEYLGVSQQYIARVERQARRKLTFRLRAIGIKPLPGGRGLDLRSALRGL